MSKSDFVIQNNYLIDYTGKDEFVEIPSDVTAIYQCAFTENQNIKSVVVPDSVLEIGKAAFAKCNNLKSIELPDSLTNIESNLFSYCKSLEKIRIPKGIEVIGRFAFLDCKSLTDVEFSGNVSHIRSRAFQGCVSLKKISLPESLKRIDWRAFSYCTNLQEVSALGNEVVVGCELFYKASSEIYINYNGDSDNFKNMIISKERKTPAWEISTDYDSFHSPVLCEKDNFFYGSAKDFCITVKCQKDGKCLTFLNTDSN